VREEDGAAASPGRQALQNMLPEGVVGTALGRGAVEVTAPGVRSEGVAVPLLDGIGRIRQHHVEAHETITLHQFGFSQGIAALDTKILDAVQEAVHAGDGGRHQVAFLPVEAHIAPLLPMPTQVRDGGEQHAAGAAGGIIDALAGLRLEHLGHQVDNGAVRVELGSRVAGVVGEFFDEILVALAQLVVG
jgi:hypothetical protein